MLEVMGLEDDGERWRIPGRPVDCGRLKELAGMNSDPALEQADATSDSVDEEGRE